jgi:hypothetical protein
MAIKIQIRRDTTANWTLKNPVLAQGELGLDLTTKQFKIGDGVTNWATLTFFSSGGGSGGTVTGGVDGGDSADSDNYTSPTTAIGGVDSEWVLANAGLQTRKTVTVTTGSLANNATANVNITNAAKSYALLKIQTDKAAWVRLYVSDATRTADASRAQSTDPAPDAGVIAEVVTSGAQTVLISPGSIGFNNESTPTMTIPCTVTNLSGSTGTVTVTATIVRIE